VPKMAEVWCMRSAIFGLSDENANGNMRSDAH
jgi:hypothetical protein